MFDPSSSYSDFLCGSFWFWQWADSLIAAPALAESLAIKGGFLAIKGWLCNQPLRPEPLGGRTYTQSPRSSSFGGHSPSSLPPPATAAVKIPVGAKGCQGSRVSRPFFNRIKIFPRWTMDGPPSPPPLAWVNIYFSQIREEQEGNPLWQQKWDSVGCLFVIFQPATQDEPTITFNAKNGKLELKKTWPPSSSSLDDIRQCKQTDSLPP